MLKQRIITALILAPIILGGVFYLPPQGFAIFTGFLIALGGWEWANLAGWEAQPKRVGFALLVAAAMAAATLLPVLPVLLVALFWWYLALRMVVRYPDANQWWAGQWTRGLIGLLVLVPAWLGLNQLRTGHLALGVWDNNLLLIVYAFFIVWTADIGAYFAGRAWGNKKLAPQVSPGKSWAGVYGGLACVGLLAWVVGSWAQLGWQDQLVFLLISLITGIVSVLGDLLESLFKRHRGIKDSSQLLPGHGGILDRIDSLTAALPVFALCLLIKGWLSII